MAALQNTLHVSEYSPDGKLFAFINSEGKLKIWDTETSELKQEFVPKLHLSVPFTCFTWITIDNAAVAKEQNSKKARKITPYIALGSRKGGISLYSFATAKVESELTGNGHQGAVSAICKGENDILYTCGEDRHVIIWSLSLKAQISSWDVGPEQPTSLVYLTASNRLIVAGRQLKVWSIEDEKLEHTLDGHSSNVILLKYLETGLKEYVLSASKNDRVLNLWQLKETKKPKRTPISYLMEDIAYCISARCEGDGEIKIAAATRSGVLHVYTTSYQSKDEIPGKALRPTVTIEIASDSTLMVEPIPIVAASVDFGVKNKTIQFGYGDRQYLSFEQIELNDSEKRQALIRSDPKKIQLKSKDKSISLKSVTPHVDPAKVEYQSTVVRATKSSEIPMETRLLNLTLGTAGGSTNARNVAQLLIQALHSRDASLLRMVFTNKEEQVIRATLQRLPPQYVGSLVHELTLLTQKKTTHVQTAVLWLKVLVQTHASQLMAIGTIELYSRFGPLLGLIEHRANSLQSLSKLGGRLDLLVSEIKMNTEDDILASENLLVYEDRDSSDDEGLENLAGESSDDWEEDESDAENGDENMEVSDADD